MNADVVSTHIKTIREWVPSAQTSFEKAAAICAYLYNYLERHNGATGNTAAEILNSKKAVCGGMTLSMRELLAEEGIESRYAFTYGRQAAHSMIEAKISSHGYALFDPYHGVAYCEDLKEKHLDIGKISAFFKTDPSPLFYVKKIENFSQPQTLEEIYERSPSFERKDFEFPKIFLDTDGWGVAHSGFLSHIDILLTPGTAHGMQNWETLPEEERTDRPWNALALLELSPNVRLSWAYMLGFSGSGYIIQHNYFLQELVPSHRYRLELKIANAYPIQKSDFQGPAVTFRPMIYGTNSKFCALKHLGFSPGTAYQPQIAFFDLIAPAETLIVSAFAHGDLVLQSIALQEN